MASSNLLRVTVETAYSVPDSWAPVPGQHPSTCTVALEVPLMAEVRHFHFGVEQKSHSGRRLVTYSYEQGVLQVFHLRFSPITRKIKCWCSVTGSWRSEESGRKWADRRRGRIRLHLFRGTTTCLIPSSKQSLLSRRTARWPAVRYHQQYLRNILSGRL